ncbi:hypothetical protein GCM10017690_14720 [Microbacterium terregens]
MVRRVAYVHPQCCVESRAVGLRNALERVEDRQHELVQAREAELGLELEAGTSQLAGMQIMGRLPSDLIEERGLADAWLTDNNQGAARPRGKL